jgi:hypothetical protein
MTRSARLLTAMVGTTGGEDAGKMPNINYATRGYNIFYGNPMPSQAGVDPGFDRRAGAIFEVTYTEGREPVTTGTGSYQVPDGMTAYKNEGCYLAFKSSSMFTTSEFKDNLKSAVGGDVNRFGAAFEASVDFHDFQTKTSNSSLKVMFSMAECSAYTIVTNAYVMPNYTADFRTALSSLPESYGDGEEYFDLLDSFGTHMLSQVVMGARYGFMWELEERNWSNIVDAGVNTKVAASAEAEVKAGGNLTFDFQRTAQEAFAKNSVSFGMTTLGSKPTKCCSQDDEVAWTSQTILEPMPIKYNLKTICMAIFNTPKRRNCEQALREQEYCSKRVLPRGDVTACKGSSDPECLWPSDCGPARECINHHCQVPEGSSSLVPINRYYFSDTWSRWNTFHPLPAWDNEKLAGESVFYAYAKKVSGSVSINRYCHSWPSIDNTFHASPAWKDEHNCGSSVFYAYSEQRPGTVAINRYWGDTGSTFHPEPEWPNERMHSDGIFYAYVKEAKCTAHERCRSASSDADCCPSASGKWMDCCDDVSLSLGRNNTQASAIFV